MLGGGTGLATILWR